MNERRAKSFVVARAMKASPEARVADLERTLYKLTVGANNAARTGDAFEWRKYSNVLSRIHGKVEFFTGLTNRYRNLDANPKADRLFKSAVREADNLIAYMSQMEGALEGHPGHDARALAQKINKSADTIRKQVRAGVALL